VGVVEKGLIIVSSPTKNPIIETFKEEPNLRRFHTHKSSQHGKGGKIDGLHSFAAF
jgi:hypothetical protein